MKALLAKFMGNWVVQAAIFLIVALATFLGLKRGRREEPRPPEGRSPAEERADEAKKAAADTLARRLAGSPSARIRLALQWLRERRGDGG